MAMTGGGAGGGAGAIRAGAAFVEAFLKDNALVHGLEGAKRKVQGFAAGVGKVGVGLAGGAGGILGAAGFKALDTLGDTAKLSATAQAFGMTAESASRLFGIMGAAGSDIRDATEGVVTLGQRVSDALGGKGAEAAELFQQLGVSAQEFAGLAPDQQFYKLLDALSGVADPAKRVQLLLKAVGEDTGKNLIPLLGKSADEVQALGRLFEVSAGDMKAAEGATAAYSLAVADVSAAWRQVATGLAPALSQAAGAVSAVAGPVGGFLRDNRELVLAAAAATAGVGLLGAGMAAAGAAIGGTATVLGLVVATVGAIASPVGIAAAAVAGLTALFVTQTQAGQELAGSLSASFAGIAATVRETWGGVTAALRAGDLKLAGEVAMAGLNVAWQQGLAGLSAAWKAFARGLTDVFDKTFPAIKSVQATAATGIAVHLTGLMAQMGLISSAEFKKRGDELLKMNSEAQDEISKAQQEQRAKRAAERAAEDAAEAARGNPALDAAKRALADAERRAKEAEQRSRGQPPAAVNRPAGPAMPVGVAARGAFGANLANQLGTGVQPWQRANVEAARKLGDVIQRLDKTNDLLRGKLVGHAA